MRTLAGNQLISIPIFCNAGSCITDDVVMKLRICATLCLLGIVSSMFQFSLDVCGANKRGLKWLRRNSIGNIFAGNIEFSEFSIFLNLSIFLILYYIHVTPTSFTDFFDTKACLLCCCF